MRSFLFGWSHVLMEDAVKNITLFLMKLPSIWLVQPFKFSGVSVLWVNWWEKVLAWSSIFFSSFLSGWSPKGLITTRWLFFEKIMHQKFCYCLSSSKYKTDCHFPRTYKIIILYWHWSPLWFYCLLIVIFRFHIYFTWEWVLNEFRYLLFFTRCI